jgi:hypothetical protein
MHIRRVVSVCSFIAAVLLLSAMLSFAEPGDPNPLPQKSPAAAAGGDRKQGSATDVRTQPHTSGSSMNAPHGKPGTGPGGSAPQSGPGSGVGGVP